MLGGGCVLKPFLGLFFFESEDFISYIKIVSFLSICLFIIYNLKLDYQNIKWSYLNAVSRLLGSG